MPMAEPVVTVHIVGHGVMVGSVARQLCAWCGFRIMDDDWANMASSGPSGPHWWPVGQLIEVGPSHKSVIELPQGERVPPNCCAAPPPAPPSLRLVPSGG